MLAKKLQTRCGRRKSQKLSRSRCLQGEKNHFLDLLEDAIAANNRETRNFLKLLDEAQEISEDLSALPELFSKARDRSALEKTSREI